MPDTARQPGRRFRRCPGGFSRRSEEHVRVFRGFVESVAIPNKALFVCRVAWGELLGGPALIIGLFTRWTALAVVIMVVNLWFAKEPGFWVPGNHDSLYILIALAHYFSNARATLGLDGVLARRRA